MQDSMSLKLFAALICLSLLSVPLISAACEQQCERQCAGQPLGCLADCKAKCVQPSVDSQPSAAPLASDVGAGAMGTEAPVGPPPPRKATFPGQLKRQTPSRASRAQARGQRMRRTIEYNRPAFMMATSTNRGWNQDDLNFRVQLLIQPYVLWQRSVRMGLIFQRDFDNFTSVLGFLGAQGWLSDSLVVYAQLYSGNTQADDDCFGVNCGNEGFHLGGDVGTMVYLSRGFAVKAYGGVSSHRSPYLGFGLCFDWLSWARMGVLF